MLANKLNRSPFVPTVTNAMSRLVAVKAHDNDALPFHLLLWTILGDMTKLTAVRAFSEASTDRLASIFQSSYILLVAAGPEFSLTRTNRPRTESIIDSVLLV